MSSALPVGQRAVESFYRFGLSQYANRFPTVTDRIEVEVTGELPQPLRLSEALIQLERVEQVSDFHCVTTWSKRSLQWGGFRFSTFYEELVKPQGVHAEAQTVVFRCQDGFRARMALSDLLADDVLLADTLDGQPLCVAHGAPLRLVAPAHYGYKSAKHVNAIEFWCGDEHYRPPQWAFMDHPRARVALEERGQFVPGWLLRWLYRPLVGSTARQFKKALELRPRP